MPGGRYLVRGKYVNLELLIDSSSTKNQVASAKAVYTYGQSLSAASLAATVEDALTTKAPHSDAVYHAINDTINSKLNDIFNAAITCTRTSATVIVYTAASAAAATKLAANITGKIIKWQDVSDAWKYGWVVGAVAADTALTITVNGSAVAANDKLTTFAIAYSERVRVAEIFVGGTITAAAETFQGQKHCLPYAIYALSVNLKLGTAGTAFTFNLFKDTTALFTSDLDMTTETALVNQVPNTRLIEADKLVAGKIPTGTGSPADFLATIFYIPNTLLSA